MEKRNDSTCLLMLTASMVIYGTIGIFRRSIPLSSGLLACVRGFLGSAFLAAFVKLRGGTLRHGMARRDFKLLVLSGAMIGINWIFLFEAFNYTTVAAATLCYYMQPTIVILLSPLLLNEKLTKKKLLCAAAAIAGMVLVTGLPAPAAGDAAGAVGAAGDAAGAVGAAGAASGNLKGILFGLGAAALYAAVIITNKKLGPVDVYEKTILQLFFAAAVLIPYLIVTENFSALQLTAKAAALLLVLGIVHTGIAYALYFGSMDGLRAQTIALFSYIDPVVALFLSALLLKEPLTPAGMIGAVLILGSAVFSELQL
ncbi:MAG: EamA family transporter [Stomatobaculum sp.]|nr:EamA family transporter [Stomatobaculum sp.]